MDWRLGLDLGTNSIGWSAIVLLDKHPHELLDIGVRIFHDGRDGKSGAPLNETRRMARQMRRQRERRIRRKKSMLRYLIALGYLPEKNEDRLEICKLDPYELRAEALRRDLSKYEISRVLMHLVTRRGFKSNRKEQLKAQDAEKQGMLAGIQQLTNTIGAYTLGEWQYKKKTLGECIRFKPIHERTKIIYPFYPSREMYEFEFEKIKERQEKQHPELNWERIHWLIFFQRPLKRPERGRCEFYSNHDRGYKTFPSAHRFRILQDINNLRYYDASNKLVELPKDFKRRLYEKMDKQKKISFEKIRRDLLGHDYLGTFNLEDERRNELTGNATAVDMRSPDRFGAVWDLLEWSEQDSIIESLILEDDESRISQILNKYNLSGTQIKKILGTNFPTGTTRLSSKFMIDCARIMLEEEIPYHEATLKLGVHHSDTNHFDIQKKLPYYGKILFNYVSGAKGSSFTCGIEEQFGRIANPTVHIALNQLRKLMNALIRRFGLPTEIILEVGRELKLSKEKKVEIFREQVKNQQQNERIKAELVKLGFINPSGEDIKKYRLWEELAPIGLARRCPYCGRTISANQAMSGETEIEHILPYSRTLLDSRDNLTIAHRECNRLKRERTPYEAFGTNPHGYEWETITEMAKALPFRKRVKFSMNSMDRFMEDEGGFLARQITDNAYIAKAATIYLSCICDKNNIWPSVGKLTAKLRGEWGINTLLNSNHDTWHKNRSDHRHHALDAVVIGLCDRGLIQETARMNALHGYREISVPPCPIPRDEIERRLTAIVVSHKPDHGKEGCLYKETALGKRQIIERIKPDDLEQNDLRRIVPKTVQSAINKVVEKIGLKSAKKTICQRYDHISVFRDKWVTRAPIGSLSERDIDNIVDSTIKKELKDYLGTNNSGKTSERLEAYSRESGIRTIRYFPKDQKPYDDDYQKKRKAYMSSDYYRVDIWEIPKKNPQHFYEGTFIPRNQANRLGSDFSPEKPHPAAKFIMSLYKEDVIELYSNEKKTLCRIAGFAANANKLDIQPLACSDTIATWTKSTRNSLVDSYWPPQIEGQFHRAINVLFSGYRIRKTIITVDGRLIYR